MVLAVSAPAPNQYFTKIKQVYWKGGTDCGPFLQEHLHVDNNGNQGGLRWKLSSRNANGDPVPAQLAEPTIVVSTEKVTCYGDNYTGPPNPWARVVHFIIQQIFGGGGTTIRDKYTKGLSNTEGASGIDRHKYRNNNEYKLIYFDWVGRFQLHVCNPSGGDCRARVIPLYWPHPGNKRHMRTDCGGGDDTSWTKDECYGYVFFRQMYGRANTITTEGTDAQGRNYSLSRNMADVDDSVYHFTDEVLAQIQAAGEILANGGTIPYEPIEEAKQESIIFQ